MEVTIHRPRPEEYGRWPTDVQAGDLAVLEADRRTAQVGAGRIEFRDLGDPDSPDVVVLLHGMANDWRMWSLPAIELAQRYRVLCPDIPGFGGSENRSGRLDVADVVKRFDEWLSGLLPAESKLVVVGHSLGGLVAAHWASEAPGRLSGAMVVSAPPIAALGVYSEPISSVRSNPREVFALGSLLLAGVVPFKDRLLPSLLRTGRGRNKILKDFIGDPRQIEPAILTHVFSHFGSGQILRAALNGFNYNYERVYREIGTPTSSVRGAKDHLFSASDQSKFLELVPGSTGHLIEDSAHLPMIERAALMSEIIAEFVDSVS